MAWHYNGSSFGFYFPHSCLAMSYTLWTRVQFGPLGILSVKCALDRTMWLHGLEYYPEPHSIAMLGGYPNHWPNFQGFGMRLSELLFVLYSLYHTSPVIDSPANMEHNVTERTSAATFGSHSGVHAFWRFDAKCTSRKRMGPSRVWLLLRIQSWKRF